MTSKNIKILCTSAALFVALSAGFTLAPAQFLYPNYMTPKAATPWEDTPYDSVLSKTWQGIKSTLVDAYPTGLVHRPKSNRPGDAVSEGVSYGMLLALYMNDQTYFNKIWEAGVRRMWRTEGWPSGNYYDWRRDPSGNAYPDPGDNGPASDADQDIALLLIFADRLVTRNIWRPYSGTVSGGYAAHARLILESIRTTMVAGNGALLPGRWGGDDGGTINPGYFAPAFYKIFAEFDPQNAAAWKSLTDACYSMIGLSPGYARGLLPDWFNFEGRSTGGAGYNAYFDGDAMYRDAIRIHWRLATDYLWYKDTRAKQFLDNAMTFLEGKGGPAAANFYQMNGNLLPTDGDAASEILGDGSRVNIKRARREHSHLTLGMWAAAAMGSGGTALAQKYSDALLGFYKPGTSYFGHAVDTTGGLLINGERIPEDTLRNEMYFDQFLAWFGASILAGNFTNVWEDLKTGVPQGPPAWVNRPKNILDNWNIDACDKPFEFGASFSRAVRWSVELRHDQTNATAAFSGNSATVSVVWHGTNSAGSYMPQGWYTLTLSAEGLEHKVKVWLGRPCSSAPNLLSGNRLLVDDFADNDLFPYIGKEWTYHVRSENNVNPTVTMNAVNEQLRWAYTLNGSNWRVATLDWMTGAEMNFGGGNVDTIVLSLSSQVAGLEVSAQLLSGVYSAGDDQFFENVFTLPNTSLQTVRLPTAAAHWNERMYGTGGGKSFASVLPRITGIRLHVQYDADHPQVSTFRIGEIRVNSMHLAGRNVSSLYTYEPPPAYLQPTGDPEAIGVARRSARVPEGFSIRKTAGAVRVTMPRSMAGADVVMLDIRGRTVRRMKAPADGAVNITARGLAAGMYFVEIKKRGVKTVRVPFNNVR